MQFRLSALFAYTTVIAIGVAALFQTNPDPGALPIGIGIFFVVPLLAIPSLLERAIDRKMPMEFGSLLLSIQILFISLNSCFCLFVSTMAFAPDWKGSKGMGWIFYVNDGLAGALLLPFYACGAWAFIYAAAFPKLASKRPVLYFMLATNVLVSLTYVFYVWAMQFAGHRQLCWHLLAPGIPAIAYGLMLVALLRREFPTASKSPWQWAWIWLASFGAALVAKVPLAMHYYATLPNEPPDSCFIVTAACRGHRRIVGASFDMKLQRVVNQQLLCFWQFEELLTNRFPNFQRFIRQIYNHIGPSVARRIRFRWQADIVYMLLKPIEWTIRGLLMLFSGQSKASDR